MAFYESLNFVFDPILGPLMILGPFLALLIMSFAISLLITLVYKWVTDQALMKSLKDDITRHQKEMKEHRNNPSKMMEIQKSAMDKNMKYMMHSLRPTLYTFIPLILIFGWLSSNFAYEPINQMEKVDVYMFFNNAGVNGTGYASIIVPAGITLISNDTSGINKISVGEKLLFNNPYLTKARYGGFIDTKSDIFYAGWKIHGEEGKYTLEIKADGKSYFKDILIDKRKYVNPLEKVENDAFVKGIAVDQKQMIVIDIFGLQIAWFWSYVLLSVIMSMALRKALKVY